jgi:hypothetical protein
MIGSNVILIKKNITMGYSPWSLAWRFSCMVVIISEIILRAGLAAGAWTFYSLRLFS